MNIKKEIVVNQPIDDVWEVLGNQFGEDYKWARGLYHSKAYGNPTIEGATCSNRACDTTQGKIDEALRKFDPDHYTLEYEVIKGFPFFVKSGTNNWRLSPNGQSTKVYMDFNLETKGLIGAIMNPMMKMQMNKIIEGVLEDFKHYTEKGIPSPGKERELAKQMNKAA